MRVLVSALILMTAASGQQSSGQEYVAARNRFQRECTAQTRGQGMPQWQACVDGKVARWREAQAQTEQTSRQRQSNIDSTIKPVDVSTRSDAAGQSPQPSKPSSSDGSIKPTEVKQDFQEEVDSIAVSHPHLVKQSTSSGSVTRGPRGSSIPNINLTKTPKIYSLNGCAGRLEFTAQSLRYVVTHMEDGEGHAIPIAKHEIKSISLKKISIQANNGNSTGWGQYPRANPPQKEVVRIQYMVAGKSAELDLLPVDDAVLVLWRKLQPFKPK